MIKLSASADFGLTGHYIARVLGRDSKFTFRREFIGRKGGKRNEYAEADVDDPGLYETCSVERKRGKHSRYYLVLYLVVSGVEDGAQTARVVSADTEGASLDTIEATKEEAMKLAKLIDSGVALASVVRIVDYGAQQIEILSPAAAAKIEQAQTLESATEACWAALQPLPERDAKKVLAALKLRVSPPKADGPTPSEPADSEAL
jgi:hypothetical protein